MDEAPKILKLTARAGRRNDPQLEKSVTGTIPRGSRSIRLEYRVSTEEYKKYIQKENNPYNDVWYVQVLAGESGKVVYEKLRSVNTQLASRETDKELAWQADGRTGLIQKEIDVTEEAREKGVSVTLVVAALNVADSRFPTEVRASLDLQPCDIEAKITGVTAEKVEDEGPFGVNSIPPPKGWNYYHQYYRLAVEKGADVDYAAVSVQIVSRGGEWKVLSEDLSVELSGERVVVEENGLRVRVTMDSEHPCEIPSPPPFATFKYRFNVTFTNGSGERELEAESGELTALWKMPESFASRRYGQVLAQPTKKTDQHDFFGGDHWCSKSTYDWLETHQDLVTRINDISGEHGIDIGHSSHRTGNDIDIYQFYPVLPESTPNETQGLASYNNLKEKLIQVVRGSAEGLEHVKAWIRASREGLDRLAQSDRVRKIYFTDGLAISKDGIRLDKGWLMELLSNGRTWAVWDIGGTDAKIEIETSLGTWTPSSKIGFEEPGHESHIHVALHLGSQE